MGLTLSGEAKREAPAQTELRPTFAFARASHHNRARRLSSLSISQSWPARSIMGLTLSGEAQREAPAQTELRPTFARASYRNRARARPRYRSSIVASTLMGANIVRARISGKPRLRRSFALPSPSLVLLIVIVLVLVLVIDLQSWPARLWG